MFKNVEEVVNCETLTFKTMSIQRSDKDEKYLNIVLVLFSNVTGLFRFPIVISITKNCFVRQYVA